MVWLVRKLRLITKTKKHLNDAYHKCIGRINTIHELCKQPAKLDLHISENKSPYQLVSHWLLDVLSYGFILTFIYNTWFGWQGWQNIALLFANGFAVWMFIEVIKLVKETVSN